MVDPRGFEPLTPAMRMPCSTTELRALIESKRRKCTVHLVVQQGRPSTGRKVIGILLIVLGLFALLTPLTPGAWLIFVGAGLLGVRLAFWHRLRGWWSGGMVEALTHKQANTAMEEKEIGKVVHYFDKIKVAIIELTAPLKVGDRIKIKRSEEEFEQDITSMQVNHEDVTSGKKGDSVGIKVDKETKDGAHVFKVTE